MIHLGSNVMFMRMHYDILFAPTFGDWSMARKVEPATGFDSEVASSQLSQEFRGSIWKYQRMQTAGGMWVEQIVGHHMPYIARKKTYNHYLGRYLIEGNEYEFWWGSYKEFTYNPDKDDPTPEYLKSFNIEGDFIRQAIEAPNGCTYYALTSGHKLYEIDRE